jgi:hypothetical protein
MAAKLAGLNDKPSTGRLVIFMFAGLALVIFCMVSFSPYQEILEQSGYDLVAQQLAFSYEKSEIILEAWQSTPGGIEAGMMIHRIDLFLFILAYTLLGLCWGVLVSRYGAERIRYFGFLCSVGILAAAVADIIETGTQMYITSHVGVYWSSLIPIMSTFAVIKFLFFYITAIWCVIGSVILIGLRLANYFTRS